MKLLSFSVKEKKCFGIEKNEKIYDISNYENEKTRNLNEFIKKGINICDIDLNNEYIDVYEKKEIKILKPLEIEDNDLICVGKNYVDHVEEMKNFSKENFKDKVIYFSKMSSSIIGAYDNILLHKDVTQKLDYECELAVIISKDAYKLKKEEVKDYIYGYTIFNDVSARDLQINHTQWYKGKSLKDTCPLGPYIITSDEIDFPPKLNIKTIVNGEIRQNNNTINLIHSLEDIIVDLTSSCLLKSGTIISTGTPSGVGNGFNPPKYFKEGDVIECIIEKIGSQKNKITADQSAFNGRFS